MTITLHNSHVVDYLWATNFWVIPDFAEPQEIPDAPDACWDRVTVRSLYGALQ